MSKNGIEISLDCPFMHRCEFNSCVTMQPRDSPRSFGGSPSGRDAHQATVGRYLALEVDQVVSSDASYILLNGFLLVTD
jgi:hypothetical protein